MKIGVVLRVAAPLALFVGLVTPMLQARQSPLLTVDEASRIWGSASGDCTSDMIKKPCTNTNACLGSFPKCNGSCSAACDGAATDVQCSTGTAFKECDQNLGGTDCGKFIVGQTCAVAAPPPNNTSCGCKGQGAPGGPCPKFSIFAITCTSP